MTSHLQQETGGTGRKPFDNSRSSLRSRPGSRLCVLTYVYSDADMLALLIAVSSQTGDRIFADPLVLSQQGMHRYIDAGSTKCL